MIPNYCCLDTAEGRGVLSMAGPACMLPRLTNWGTVDELLSSETP